MLDLELLSAIIAGRGDVLRHQPVSEAKIIPKFLPRQLRAIKAMRYGANPCPIPRCPMKAVSLPAPCLLLPLKDLGEINRPFSKSQHLAGLTYACPMAYVVEDGTS